MTAQRETSFETVRAALRRSRAGQLVLAGVLAAIAGLSTFGIDGDATTGDRVKTYGVTAFFGLVTLALVWSALVKSSPDRSPLMVALRTRPDDVVWLYVQHFDVNVGGINAPVRDCNVIARLADGSTAAITVSKAKADEVMAALIALAPRAVVGFSDEREARYKVDPRSVV